MTVLWAPPGGWVIGRRPQAQVCLEYDPYISVENSEILGRRGALAIHDLPSANNGTRVNWERVPAGAERTLANGGIIGVGRSLLVFKTQ